MCQTLEMLSNLGESNDWNSKCVELAVLKHIKGSRYFVKAYNDLQLLYFKIKLWICNV